MSEHGKPDGKRWSRWATIAVAVPVLYILSIAPIAFIVGASGSEKTPEWVDLIYAPLESLDSNSCVGRWLMTFGWSCNEAGERCRNWWLSLRR